jgi:hypothetical protein
MGPCCETVFLVNNWICMFCQDTAWSRHPSCLQVMNHQWRSLTPKHRRHHFVAYDWQCTSLDNRGRQFFVQDFWDSLVSKLSTTPNWKISLGCLLLSVKMSFAKTTDDHIGELSVKSSKENTKIVSLLKRGNKVVEVGWIHSKVEVEEGTIVGSKLGTRF